MMISKKFWVFLAVIFCNSWLLFTMQIQAQTVRSPNGLIEAMVEIKNGLRISISYKKETLLLPSKIGMDILSKQGFMPAPSKILGSKLKPYKGVLENPLGISRKIEEAYEELTVKLSGNFSIQVRAYDDGLAYRFVTSFQDKIIVKNELAEWQFNNGAIGHFAQVDGTQTSFESFYEPSKINALDTKKLIYPPFLMQWPKGTSLAVVESDLLDYPGMFLKHDSSQSGILKGFWAKYPEAVEQGGHNGFNYKVVQTKPFIAETQGTRSFPWRVFAIGQNEAQLTESQLVYKLASPSKIADASWVKPGLTCWEWWNNWDIYGVPFKAGINMETYKYYIDFASKNNIPYLMIDDGWSESFDLTKTKNGMDIAALSAYAKSKNVRLMLWCVWHTLEKQMNPALDLFQKWDIAGIKVDFMDRNDQYVVNFYERICEGAAKRKLMVDFHGAFPGTGLERTWPNQVNREGIRGLEFFKFSKTMTAKHLVTIPFTRMLAGPMDFTPGSMNNVSQKDFAQVFEHPQTIGTRCNQLAMFVVYYGPLQMLADAPLAYEKERESLDFIKKVPTVWDETRCLSGKIGEHIVMARRKGSTWYVGGMTAEALELDLPLNFLSAGKMYRGKVFRDGINVDRNYKDFDTEDFRANAEKSFPVKMGVAGGFVLKLELDKEE